MIYVFDLDGVLIDSMPRYEAAMLSILDEAGISYDSELIKFITPLGYTKTAEHYITLGVNDTVENMVSQMRERLVFEYTNNIKLKPGVKEYLEKLKGENARLFVLTASPHIVTDVCLTNNGVYHLFEKVWSVEDFGLTKSDMKLFDDVSAAIGCENSDINYFDDNLIAVTNAAKAGYFVFGVFDRHDERDTAELKEKANVFVRSFEELI